MKESYVERWAREQKEAQKEAESRKEETVNEQNAGSEGQETKKAKRGRKQTCVVEQSDSEG